MSFPNLQTLIMRAYGIKAYQLESGPKWMTTDYFDVSAKAARDTATDAEMNEGPSRRRQLRSVAWSRG